MKKIIFLFLLISADFIYGQYTPMLETGKIWNMRYHTDYGSYFDFNIVATETVELNGLTYHHIEATHNGCDTFLREDISEKKIYGIWEGEEYLHYDFSLDVGDSIWILGDYQLITAIGFGDFYGMENLRYYILDNNTKLIEGIGFEQYGITDAFEYGCLNIDFGYFVLTNMNQPLSLNEIVSSEISIYPNPVKDKLGVNNTNLNIQSIQLYDVLGKKVLQEINNFQQIDVSNLNQGVYLVKIESDKGVITKKVIKE